MFLSPGNLDFNSISPMADRCAEIRERVSESSKTIVGPSKSKEFLTALYWPHFQSMFFHLALYLRLLRNFNNISKPPYSTSKSDVCLSIKSAISIFSLSNGCWKNQEPAKGISGFPKKGNLISVVLLFKLLLKGIMFQDIFPIFQEPLLVQQLVNHTSYSIYTKRYS